MQALRNVRITGTGMYVPPRVVKNADLAELMDTTDEWIRQRTGIEERHRGVAISALDGRGLKELLERVEWVLWERDDSDAVPPRPPKFAAQWEK